MTQATDLQNISMTVGELKGQMREVVHGMNNMSQKIDGIADKVSAASNLPAKVAEIDARVKILEATENKRAGAMGFGGWLLKSPAIGWLAGAAITAWAILTGKVH